MSQNEAVLGGRSINSIFRALSSLRRRRILIDVASRTNSNEGVSETELAARLVAMETDKPVVSVTDDERRASRIALAHGDLPALEDANVIAWNRDDGTVSLSEAPAIDWETIRRTAEPSADVDAWDAVFGALADNRRRTALAVLEAADEPMDREELAACVAAQERAVDVEKVSSAAVDEVLVALHHVHLPTLRDAKLVEETEEGVVYAGERLELEEVIVFDDGVDVNPAPPLVATAHL